MVLAWRSYQSDLGRAYPMLALYVAQLNDVSSNINPTDLLPPLVTDNLLVVGNTCGVDGLTLRSIVLWSSDGAMFAVNYPKPFDLTLFNYLTEKLEVAAFEFIGEKLKYGRLKRLLDNV